MSLTPAQQLKVLARIWGADREGYVFMPWISGSANTAAQRRRGYHEGRAFKWPADKSAILDHLATHDTDDLYFAPCLFEDKRRIETYATPERALWADMDEADPRTVSPDLRPTIAWESSPGRYQAVWLLSRPLVGASWAGKENHRLTMAVGADPSGWDTTQLLRVPGRANHKPDYRKDNGGEPVPGKLLWDNGPRYTADDFSDLPEITSGPGDDVDMLDEDLISSVDRHEVWARVRLRVTKTVREMMSLRDPEAIGDRDRSEALWQVVRNLGEAGCNVVEIVALVRPTVWNKFAGRNDELKRLKLEAAKSVALARDAEPTLEEAATEKPDVRWLSDVMSEPNVRPKWLVRNVWSRGACGFISGDPKSYKSWMALDMAVSLATGMPFLNDPSHTIVGGARPVLFLEEEDGMATMRARIGEVVDGKCPRMHWHGYMERGDDGAVYWCPPDGEIKLALHVRHGFTASDDGWQAWLDEIVGAHFKGGMVLVDTMGTTAGAVDTDRAPEVMSRILRPLKTISEKHDVAVGIIHHNAKGSGDKGNRAGQRMLGSVALHAWVEDALYVRDKETLPNGTTRVSVERESKSGADYRFRVEVPLMHTGGSGGGEGRVAWSPAVVPWSMGDDASTASPDGKAGGSDGGGRRGPGAADGEPARGRGAVGGGKVAMMLRQMGATTDKRAKGVDDLAAVMDVTASAVRRQLATAERNGLAASAPDGRWFAVKPTNDGA